MLARNLRWIPHGGLRQTPRDFARFAYLLFQNGWWAGASVVPEEYLGRIKEDGGTASVLTNGDGYFDSAFGGTFPPDALRTYGAGVNMSVIFPTEQLICLRTGSVSTADWDAALAIQSEFVQRMMDMLLP